LIEMMMCNGPGGSFSGAFFAAMSLRVISWRRDWRLIGAGGSGCTIDAGGRAKNQFS
jgi:hypothetical protein